ncbi:MAG: YdcF family protein [Lysobacteraceae bacterium]|nr:YdcF family protein [Xanthomonadaceae bacterium]HRX98966.1 YdcF family protein [Xanthomonadaceae bacterium]
MTTRREHRQSLLRDPDALHGLAVSTLLLLLSGGLLYLFYLWRVWRVAVAAPVDIEPGAPTWLLLFGKRCEDGCPDADFRMRIDRAAVLADDHPDWRLVLLGGGPAPTEAEVASRELVQRGIPRECLLLEDQSRDTLQNLRHARDLLAGDGIDLILLSNRYHLARCLFFAECLGLSGRPCGAESVWSWTAGGKLLVEAAYLMWVDIGRRWARLIGHRRMLAKVS